MIYKNQISEILNEWFERNRNHPYASKAEKTALSELTSLTEKQITTWLINARQKHNFQKHS